MRKVVLGLLFSWICILFVSRASVVQAQCVPVCEAPLCGQDDGCGGMCSDSDQLVPPAPTSLAPVNDADVTATNITIGGLPHKRVILSIQAQQDPSYNASRLYLELYPVGTSCANPLAECLLIASSVPTGQVVEYHFDIPLTNYEDFAQYQWRVRHQNSTCGQQYSEYSAWSVFTLVDTFSGNVFLDDSSVGMSGGVCASLYAPFSYFPQGLGERVRASHQATGRVQEIPLTADGSFSFTAPVGLTNLEFLTDGSSSVCACPAGDCQYESVSGPATQIHFYYQPFEDRKAWWQVIGGNLFAGEMSLYALSSLIPDTCIHDCRPFVSLRDSGGRVESSGSVITGGGGIDTSSLLGSQKYQIDEDNRDYFVQGSIAEGMVENYDFFSRMYSLGMEPEDDLIGYTTVPEAEPVNGRAFFRNGSMSIRQPVHIKNGRQVVLFIDGNLNIENPIHVQAGSFLAFIVRGHITVDADVCQTDPESSDPVVEGVYVANGKITIESRGNGDCKFVGAGIFAGWGGIELNRDFRDGGDHQTWNARNPVELFIYRPDLVVNTPDRMKRSLMEWQEVAP